MQTLFTCSPALHSKRLLYCPDCMLLRERFFYMGFIYNKRIVELFIYKRKVLYLQKLYAVKFSTMRTFENVIILKMYEICGNSYFKFVIGGKEDLAYSSCLCPFR